VFLLGLAAVVGLRNRARADETDPA
jgi:hypothetical protein